MAGSRATLFIGGVTTDFTDGGVNPAGRGLRIGKYLRPQFGYQPAPNLRNDFGRDPILGQRFQGMDDEGTRAQFEAGLFEGGMLELQRCLSDHVPPIRAIGQIDKF